EPVPLHRLREDLRRGAGRARRREAQEGEVGGGAMIASVDKLEVLRPRRLKEALAMLAEAAEAGAPLTPLAGGTDLFVTLNAGVEKARRFLDLWDLRELRHLDEDGRTLTFGALTTYTDCIRSRV